MANEDLINQKVFCVMCTKEVPAERLRFRSVTCSDEHARLRQRLLRKRVDDRSCRFCHKPSTPAQRKAFARFRKWERENPTLAYPEIWAIVNASGITEKDFGKAVHQSVKADVMLDWQMSDLEWGSTKAHLADAPPALELERVLMVLSAYATEHPKPEPSQAATEEADATSTAAA